MSVSDVSPSSDKSAPPRFRLKFLPILYTLLLGLLVLFLAANSTALVEKIFKLPKYADMPWVEIYYGHIAQLFWALVAIAILKWVSPGNYGLRWPKGKTYIRAAIMWCLIFAVIMSLSDIIPFVLHHRPPQGHYQLTPINVAGWLSFEGIFVGPSEEILFRGLLITFLVQRMPGTVSLGRFSMNGAGLVVAVLFALAHAGSFATGPLSDAIYQQFYAFALGVLYAYWFEKSGSVVAPIIGHNVSDVVSQLITFGLVAAAG